MINLKQIILVLQFLLFIVKPADAQDWANLNFNKVANTKIEPTATNEYQVVFMGNSITQFWSDAHPAFFANKPYINKGISEQTTSQMLNRFDADVIKQNPSIVVFLGGTNDIAQNGGPITVEQIMENISSMAQIKKTNGIKVVLCSVLPVYQYNWRPDIKPIEQIISLNALIEKYTEDNDMVYADFYSSLVNEEKGLKSEYSNDGVHPNLAGYLVMEPIVEAAIQKATTPATSIAISPSTLNMTDNSISQLSLIVTPEGASKNVTWSSSNPSIATVSLSGLVRALALARLITATNPDGSLTSTCFITVTASGNQYIYQTVLRPIVGHAMPTLLPMTTGFLHPG
ncbi:MAG: Ig-like domain-containing protein [Draconibacterium sp.]|nr:Ig-like domain-containing protein [Draconibacterium sp.]